MVKYGLSIRGGGMKSVAYIGALKALEENNIELIAAVCVSGAAVIMSSYGAGKTLDQIYKHFQDFKPYSLVSLTGILNGKIINYQKWVEYAHKLVPAVRIEDSKIKLFIQATNIRTGNLDYLETGDAVEAVIASSAVVTPYEFKGVEYLDGEYDPEFGTQKLREYGCDKVISLEIQEDTPSYSILNLLSNFRITQKNALNLDNTLNPVDFRIKINLPSSSPFSRKDIETKYQQGYEQTLKALAIINLSAN